jgi:hypothetical protein
LKYITFIKEFASFEFLSLLCVNKDLREVGGTSTIVRKFCHNLLPITFINWKLRNNRSLSNDISSNPSSSNWLKWTLRQTFTTSNPSLLNYFFIELFFFVELSIRPIFEVKIGVASWVRRGQRPNPIWQPQF